MLTVYYGAEYVGSKERHKKPLLMYSIASMCKFVQLV